MVTMLMDFPFQTTSELMRDRTSHRGTWMPYPATARIARDGEVPFIRKLAASLPRTRHTNPQQACLYPLVNRMVSLFFACGCLAASPAHATAWEVEALLEAAQASHPLVGARQAERQAAQADLASANWQRYPSVSAELAAASTGSGNRLLRVDQPLWNGGRIAAGIRAADSRVSAAQTAIAETRQELRLRVVTAANEALRQQARRRVALDNLAEHDRLQTPKQAAAPCECGPTDQPYAPRPDLNSASCRRMLLPPQLDGRPSWKPQALPCITSLGTGEKLLARKHPSS